MSLPNTIINKTNYHELFNKEQFQIIQQLCNNNNELYAIPAVHNAFSCMVANMHNQLEAQSKQFFLNMMENKGPRATEIRNLARSMLILQCDGFPNVETLENKIQASGPSNKDSNISNSNLVKEVNSLYLNNFDWNNSVFNYFGKSCDNYKTATSKIHEALNACKNLDGVANFIVSDTENVPVWPPVSKNLRFNFPSGVLTVQIAENKLEMKYHRKETLDAGSQSYLKTELTLPFPGSVIEHVFYGFSVLYFYNELEDVRFFDETLHGLPDDIKRFMLKFVYQMAGISEAKLNYECISKESFIDFFKSNTFDLNGNKKNEAFFKKMSISAIQSLNEEPKQLIVYIPFSFFGDDVLSAQRFRFGDDNSLRIEILEDNLTIKHNCDKLTFDGYSLAAIVNELKENLEAFNQTPIIPL